MTTAPSSPFSARNRREKNWIAKDFPASARNGLFHVLVEAVEQDYLLGWHVIVKELRRIARDAPIDYDATSINSIRAFLLKVYSKAGDVPRTCYGATLFG